MIGDGENGQSWRFPRLKLPIFTFTHFLGKRRESRTVLNAAWHRKAGFAFKGVFGFPVRRQARVGYT
jgi:hypothetical protein